MRLIVALALAFMLTPLGGCRSDAPTAPEAETLDERRALKDAEEMIGARSPAVGPEAATASASPGR